MITFSKRQKPSNENIYNNIYNNLVYEVSVTPFFNFVNHD